MKTVCPHCNQEYDVEDSFLQQEVTCTVCNQNFFVNKAKFCADCGTVNPAQAFKCRQCGKNFPLSLRENATTPPIVSHSENHSSGYKEPSITGSAEKEKTPWFKKRVQKKEKVEYDSNIWGVIAIFLSLGTIFLPILTLPAIIYALLVHASRGQRYLSLIIIGARIIIFIIMENVRLGN